MKLSYSNAISVTINTLSWAIDQYWWKGTEMDIDPDYTLIDFMRRPIVKNIASLHQLQNLYYMLLIKSWILM